MMTTMHEHCPECGLNITPEPSFYTGAMYVSYAFSVALVISVFVAFNVLYDDPNVNHMIFTGIGLAFFLAPLNIRFSRTIWAYLFFRYDKDALHQKEDDERVS
jgi:hypothetical protein